MKYRLIHISSKSLWTHLKNSQLVYDPDIAFTMPQACKTAMDPMRSHIAYLNMREAVLLIANNQTSFSSDKWSITGQAVSIFSAVLNNAIKNKESSLPFAFKATELKCNIRFAASQVKHISGNYEQQTASLANKKRDGVDISVLPNIYTKGITVIKSKETFDYDTYLTQDPNLVLQSHFNKLQVPA